ncbi:MAG TPA: gluconate 2-dehydrogenase subunit 3 family protein [Membranihabitans sp.]|nr:gluconate 2-dehydrogenase subunit 3 family protein [Membranihabitans sp.]
MTRRDVLKRLAVLSGGIMLVPSCDFSREDVLLAYDNLQVSQELQAVLQKLCNTIIPSDTTYKGAEELELSNFVLVMVNDCYSTEKQKNFMEGLKSLSQYAEAQTRQNILSLSQDHAVELLRNILDHPEIEEENRENDEAVTFEQIRYCVHTTKTLTIQGYMASEYIMRDVMPYQLIPGPFHGKVAIDKNERINING